MKPYIEYERQRLYLPQEVDPHRFEVCIQTFGGGTPFFLLCPVIQNRYRQATGAVLERTINGLGLHMVGGRIITRTFPLEGLQTKKIQVDWQAGGSVSIQHNESTEETQD